MPPVKVLAASSTDCARPLHDQPAAAALVGDDAIDGQGAGGAGLQRDLLGALNEHPAAEPAPSPTGSTDQSRRTTSAPLHDARAQTATLNQQVPPPS